MKNSISYTFTEIAFGVTALLTHEWVSDAIAHQLATIMKDDPVGYYYSDIADEIADAVARGEIENGYVDVWMNASADAIRDSIRVNVGDIKVSAECPTSENFDVVCLDIPVMFDLDVIQNNREREH